MRLDVAATRWCIGGIGKMHGASEAAASAKKALHGRQERATKARTAARRQGMEGMSSRSHEGGNAPDHMSGEAMGTSHADARHLLWVLVPEVWSVPVQLCKSGVPGNLL